MKHATDYLWFDELHLTSVWRSVLGTKIALGGIFTLLFFALLWANLAIADLIAPTFRPLGPEEQLIERYHEAVGQRAGLVRAAVAAAFALIVGIAFAARYFATAELPAVPSWPNMKATSSLSTRRRACSNAFGGL